MIYKIVETILFEAVHFVAPFRFPQPACSGGLVYGECGEAVLDRNVHACYLRAKKRSRSEMTAPGVPWAHGFSMLPFIPQFCHQIF